MSFPMRIAAVLALAALIAARAWAADKPGNEVTRTMPNVDAAWRDALVRTGAPRIADLPFSFTYDGKRSSDWLAQCKFERSARKLDKDREEHTLVYTDPTTGLLLRCVAVDYADFPTVEWTLYFKNGGSADTPIIENIQALDVGFSKKPDAGHEYVLHHNKGTVVTTVEVPAGQHDFEPLTTVLKPGTDLRFVPPQGRPCAGEFPYYNLECDGGGTIIVVGWPGAWAARFARDTDSLRVTAGQKKTHFILHPQEEVRSPRIVIQQYRGDWIAGQNIWRKWMFAHNVPRPGGKTPEPMTGAYDGYYFDDLTITQDGEKHSIDRYVEERLVPDCWWMDAGWYQKTNKDGTTSWTLTGTWEVDKKRFPEDLRPVFDYAKSKGVRQGVLWFEPERVAPTTWLYEERPQWLLGRDGQFKLLNLGNPEALEWAINMVDRTMSEAGVTIYREDFNFAPLDCWTFNEPENRQGINEIKHVTGHLEFWKELLRRNPDRLIDTCASGGHRIDLDTLRLSVPLWRSDYPWEPIGMQCQTYGLSMWVPYQGTGVTSDDAYTVRSDMAPFFLMSWDMNRRDLNYDGLRKLMAEWRRISEYYQGDYYPLTEYSLSNAVWMAWQFNRTDKNAGIVQVFRRADSPYETASLKLRGLDPAANYKISDAETGNSFVMTGKDLMDSGMPVAMKTRPSAATYIYAP